MPAIAGAGSAASASGGLKRSSPPPHLVDSALVVVLAVALTVELLVLFTSTFARTIFHASWNWSQEVAELCLVTLAFIGSALAYRRGKHLSLRILVDRFPASWDAAVRALGDCLVFTTAAVSAVLAGPTLLARWTEVSPVLGLRETWFVAPLFAGMVLVAVFALENLLRRPRRDAAVAALIVAALAALVYGPHAAGTATAAYALPLSLVSFVVLVIVGVPIGFVLVLAGEIYLLWSGSTPPLGAIQSMQSISENFILLAIPFFILAGFLMTAGGLSKPLAHFVASLIGHVRGGLLQAVVATMYLFSGISGSKVADVAAVGSTMVPALLERGYRGGEIVSVLAASAVMGETVPPSIAMLVLGSVTTVSMSALFLAGIVPALVIGLCLMALVFLRASANGVAREPAAPWRARGRAAVRALPALLVPVILAYGILGGIGTPTEVSSFAVVYAAIVAAVFYRSLDARTIWGILSETAPTAGMVLFVISAGIAFSWALTVANLPQHVRDALSYAHASVPAFMIGSIALLALAGAVFEGLPALLIFAPLLLPVATQLGVDPLQYAIVIILGMGLGAFLPPIGIGFYVTCAVCGVEMESAIKPMLPYLAVLTVAILIIAFVPWFSTALPHLLHQGF